LNRLPQSRDDIDYQPAPLSGRQRLHATLLSWFNKCRHNRGIFALTKINRRTKDRMHSRAWIWQGAKDN